MRKILYNFYSCLGGKGTSNTLLSPLFTYTIGRLRKTDPAALPLARPRTRSQTQAHINLVSEPEMADPRLEHMQQEMASMEARLTKHIDEMMAALSIQFQQSRADDVANQASSSKGRTGKGSIRMDSGIPFPSLPN
jgi:hypothetical protein